MAVNIDLDAVRDRRKLTQNWLVRAVGDIGHPGGVPDSVRQHLAEDVPALIDLVVALMAERDALTREREWLAQRRLHALQCRDAMVQAAEEHLRQMIFLVDVNEDIGSDPLSLVVTREPEPAGVNSRSPGRTGRRPPS